MCVSIQRISSKLYVYDNDNDENNTYIIFWMNGIRNENKWNIKIRINDFSAFRLNFH